MAHKADVLVVGAGVMGCGTAYWLSKRGLKVTVLEQESIACGASGMAAAMLESVGHGAHLTLNDPLAELAQASFHLHHELATSLPEESGVDTGFRENPVLHPAFSGREVAELKPRALALAARNPAIQWLEGEDLWAVEPRLNREALGALQSPQAQVIAYRFVLALATAAERLGMSMLTREVVGLEQRDGKVAGVRLRNGEGMLSDTVVLAMGAWSQQVSDWVGWHIPIYPVRGQLLELRVPQPQLHASISYNGMYLVHKADGTTLAGATEEHDSGFANHPTPQGRQQILQAALHMAPSLGDAEVVDQVAGLRPCAPDGLPLIGPVPGWQGLYMVAGHFRSGMLLSAISTKLIADLIEHGQSPLPLAAFDPGRFGQTT
jgi:glycine oxidase